MNKILFLALTLSLFVSTFAGHYDGYEFFDSHGRCWRCLTGSNCVRCNDVGFTREDFPLGWDRVCRAPTAAECTQFPGAKFPAVDINRYHLCAVGQIVTVTCFCDMMFDFRNQRCAYTDQVSGFWCDNYVSHDVPPCTLRRPYLY